MKVGTRVRRNERDVEASPGPHSTRPGEVGTVVGEWKGAPVVDWDNGRTNWAIYAYCLEVVS